MASGRASEEPETAPGQARSTPAAPSTASGAALELETPAVVETSEVEVRVRGLFRDGAGTRQVEARVRGQVVARVAGDGEPELPFDLPVLLEPGANAVEIVGIGAGGAEKRASLKVVRLE
jgi:hypothetical protein